MKEKTNYNKLTADELEALLTERLAAGDIDTIREVFYKIMRHPYLCKSAAQQKALPEDLYVRTYFECVAANQIALLSDYYQTISLKAGVIINYQCYLGANFRAVWNFMRVVSDTHQNTTEEEYKKIVPALDSYAKSLEPTGYISYEEGTGVYTVQVGEYVADLRRNRESAVNLAAIARTSIKAAEDTIEALQLRKIIPESTIAKIEGAKEAVETFTKAIRADYADFISICNKAFVREAIEGNKGEAFFTPADLEETIKEYADLKPLAEYEVNTENYNSYLFYFGDGKKYVFDAVFQYLTHYAGTDR